MKNNNIISALKCSIDGFKTLSSEKSAIREYILIIFSVLFVFFVKPKLILTLLLLILPILLLSIEALNTAIELICNEITKKKSTQIKKIKDLGSTSVLLALFAYKIILLISILEFFEIQILIIN